MNDKEKPRARNSLTGPKRKKKAPPTSSLGTRLDKEQLERIEQAAAVEQWSTAQFLRVAALERAAHILNADALEVEFGDMASKIARQLLAPEVTFFDGTLADITQEVRKNKCYDECADHRVSLLNEEDCKDFVKFVKLGGAEFLTSIVGHLVIEWKRKDIKKEDVLSKAIDPDKLINRG